MAYSEKPDRPKELAHFGVRGMHWGHRKNLTSNSTPAKPKKPTTQDIHDARVRQMLRENKLNGLAADVHLARTQKGRAEAAALLQKHADVFMSGKDAQVAARMTTGEKWAAGVGWTVIGISAIAMGTVKVAEARR